MSRAFAAGERENAGSGKTAAFRAWTGSTFEPASGEAPRARADQDDAYFALASRGRRPLGEAFERVSRAIYDPLLECVKPA